MKKICFWTNSMFRVGGEQRVTTIIANELLKYNYDITIIIKHKEKIDRSLYGLDKSIRIIFMHNNYVFNLNTSKFFNYLRIINRKTGIFKNNTSIISSFFCSTKLKKEITSIINNNNFDYVIGIAGDRSFTLASLKDKLNCKIIGWNQSSIEFHFKGKNCRYYNEERFITQYFHNFEKFIVLTKNDKKNLMDYYNLKSTVINNPNSFISHTKTCLTNKKFIAMGRLSYQKGFDLLIDSFYYFAENDNEWSLNIYGEGDQQQKLEDKIKKYGMEKRIKINKPVQDVKNLLVDHSIFLMTSRNEGWGLVTVEALECGLPVIAFDIEANKKLIQNNYNGMLTKCFNTQEFSEKMFNLSKNYEVLQRLSQNCPKSVENYSIDKIIQHWIDLLI